MKNFWNKLFARGDAAAERRAEAEQVESPAERAFSTERVEDHAVDEAIEERLGGFKPDSLVDDE